MVGIWLCGSGCNLNWQLPGLTWPGHGLLEGITSSRPQSWRIVIPYPTLWVIYWYVVSRFWGTSGALYQLTLSMKICQCNIHLKYWVLVAHHAWRPDEGWFCCSKYADLNPWINQSINQSINSINQSINQYTYLAKCYMCFVHWDRACASKYPNKRCEARERGQGLN